jgi:hypothetical protein
MLPIYQNETVKRVTRFVIAETNFEMYELSITRGSRAASRWALKRPFDRAPLCRMDNRRHFEHWIEGLRAGLDRSHVPACPPQLPMVSERTVSRRMATS